MFFAFSGETAFVWRQKPPKAAFFEKYFPKPLVECEKSSYILSAE
jgi:hypothetical protein